MPQHAVSGYEEFKQFMAKLEGNISINVYFTGSKTSDGLSWCPDCNIADPHVKQSITKYADNQHFVIVDVGDREFWKNMNNPFRMDKEIHLNVIPTLIRWKEVQRLEGDQLANADLLELFFE